MKRVKALYDGLAVYAYPETIREVKMIHVHIVGTEYPNNKFRWIEERELDAKYHKEQSGSKVVKKIDIVWRGGGHTVPLREVELIESRNLDD